MADTPAVAERGNATGAPQVQLRPDDWNVPVVDTTSFKDGGSGVAITNQKEAEKLRMELADVEGSMAVITRWQIPSAGAKCMALKCKVTNNKDRLEIRDMFLTQLGKERVVPKYMKESTLQKTTVTLDNATCKVVMTMDERHVPAEVFKTAKISQRAALEAWLKKYELDAGLIYMGRPSVKQIDGRQYIEAVASFSAAVLPTLLQKSGESGSFVKSFIENDEQKGEYCVVWFDEGTTLADALSRTSRHREITHGLVSGKGGLGVRFKPGENFAANVKKVFGTEVSLREEARRNSKLYEISNVPPWVQFAQLQAQLSSTLKWDASYVRTFSRGNTKMFLVRASTKPNRDVVIHDNHWMPIQEGRPPRKAPVSKLRENKSAATVHTKRVMDPPKAPERSATRNDVSSNSNERMLNNILHAFWNKVEPRLMALESRMDVELGFMDEEDFEDGEELEDGEEGEEGDANKDKQNLGRRVRARGDKSAA